MYTRYRSLSKLIPYTAAQFKDTKIHDLEYRQIPANIKLTLSWFGCKAAGDIKRESMVFWCFHARILGLDMQATLTCGQAAELEQLIVGTTIEGVVYGGTLRPSPEKPFESLDGIQNLTGLTTLNLINRLITNISPLRTLTNLINLNLHTNWFSDLSPVSELTNLEQLVVSKNPIFDINPMAGLTKLRRLHVHGLYPHQLRHYFDMDDGRDPNVIFNGITDISPLTGLTKLTHLRIYESEIKDISPLANLNELILLWANNNQIEDISALRGMTKLQQFSLNDNTISDVSALQDMLELGYLFLSNNSIEDIASYGDSTHCKFCASRTTTSLMWVLLPGLISLKNWASPKTGPSITYRLLC